jgi:trehalose-6-phosphate synthase
MKNIRHIFEQPATQEKIKKMQKQTDGKKIILSVERLDYVKGPLEKINAFQSFLERNPQLHGKVELINI